MIGPQILIFHRTYNTMPSISSFGTYLPQLLSYSTTCKIFSGPEFILAGTIFMLFVLAILNRNLLFFQFKPSLKIYVYPDTCP